MQRIRINKQFSLEGTAFDWKLIRHFKGQTKDGEPRDSERVHYFPRLSQIAQHIVDEQAKEAPDLDTMYAVIMESTAQLIEVLGVDGYDRAFQQRMEKAIGDGKAKEIEKSEAVANPKRRTRKKTGTNTASS